MVAAVGNGENPVFGVKVSSAIPDRVTGEDKAHEFTNMDLAMKLHYLKGVYFFKNDAVGALSKLNDFKDPTFPWLGLFYMTSGRIRRRPDTGRPFIKCNDSGIRYVEAQCSKTVEEWMAMEDFESLNDRLIYSEPLGPLLLFSPTVYLQVTRFKCGGVSLGLSWAHIIGDAISAVAYMNLFGRFLSGQRPPDSLLPRNAGIRPKHPQSLPMPGIPLSVKRVEPVGDHWLCPMSPTSPKITSHSFHVTVEQLETLIQTAQVPSKPFETLSALLWKSIARIRGNSFPRIVTICRYDYSRDEENEIPRNRQRIGVAEALFHVADADLRELVELICEKTADESEVIEEAVERENSGNVDFVVYGANLTFVNLGEVNVYGMEIMGHKPIMASYNIDGVGEEGVVLVLPEPPKNDNNNGGGSGRMVNVTLPGDQLEELKRGWGSA